MANFAYFQVIPAQTSSAQASGDRCQWNQVAWEAAENLVPEAAQNQVDCPQCERVGMEIRMKAEISNGSVIADYAQGMTGSSLYSAWYFIEWNCCTKRKNVLLFEAGLWMEKFAWYFEWILLLSKSKFTTAVPKFYLRKWNLFKKIISRFQLIIAFSL